MLEILDQSTARKTRHQTQGYKQTSKANSKGGPGYAGTANKTEQTKHPGRQTNKQRQHQGEEGPRRKGEGRGRTAQDRPRDRKGETKEEKEHKQREERQQTKQKQRGREALTVLSQSTARKVRYLQVTQ